MVWAKTYRALPAAHTGPRLLSFYVALTTLTPGSVMLKDRRRDKASLMRGELPPCCHRPGLGRIASWRFLPRIVSTRATAEENSAKQTLKALA